MKRLAVLVLLVTGAGVLSLHAAELSQVLAWTPYVRINPELENVRKILGGKISETQTTSPSELQALLAGKCVLLIPEQQEKGEADLEALGKTMAGVLRAFLDGGGTIIGMTFSKGADDILRGAGIWKVDDDYTLTGDKVAIAAKDHPLAAGTAAEFTAPDATTDFSGLPEGAIVIVHDPRDRAPVVFLWRSGNGTVIMLGFDYYQYNDNTAALLRNAVQMVSCGCPPCQPCPPCDTGPRTWSSLTAADIEKLLTELGYTFERRTDTSSGDPFWVFTVEGKKVLLLVYSQTAKGSGAYRSIQLGWAGSMTPKPSLDRINEWNAKYRGTKAWLDEDRDPVLEANLYLDGGVTWENLKAFFQMWKVALATFITHLGGK